MTLASISTAGYRAPDAARSPGPAPIQSWIAIERLVIDPSYQRPIKRDGARNVERIAAAFEWAKFAPVVVAPVEGGVYAIVDGQHRTTAAALVGHDQVPCHIIQADRGKQAEAFAAINGVITPMHTGALWHAKLAGGDPAAMRLARVLGAAEVTITRYPVAANTIKPGETNSVRGLERALEAFGPNTLITALQCITQTSAGKSGMLRAALITALCRTLYTAVYWRDAGEALFVAIDKLDLAALWDEEHGQRAEATRLEERLETRIRKHLTATLGTPAQAPLTTRGGVRMPPFARWAMSEAA